MVHVAQTEERALPLPLHAHTHTHTRTHTHTHTQTHIHTRHTPHTRMCVSTCWRPRQGTHTRAHTHTHTHVCVYPHVGGPGRAQLPLLFMFCVSLAHATRMTSHANHSIKAGISTCPCLAIDWFDE